MTRNAGQIFVKNRPTATQWVNPVAPPLAVPVNIDTNLQGGGSPYRNYYTCEEWRRMSYGAKLAFFDASEPQAIFFGAGEVGVAARWTRIANRVAWADSTCRTAAPGYVISLGYGSDPSLIAGEPTSQFNPRLPMLSPYGIDYIRAAGQAAMPLPTGLTPEQQTAVQLYATSQSRDAVTAANAAKDAEIKKWKYGAIGAGGLALVAIVVAVVK